MVAFKREKSPCGCTTNKAPKNTPNGSKGIASWWRPVVLLIVVIAGLSLARMIGIGERLGALREWIFSLGGWGPLVFVFLYAVAVVAALCRAGRASVPQVCGIPPPLK